MAATLYTLVTAQIPIAATLRNRLTLDTPQKIRPELSNQISQAIMKGMALELEERPSTVDEWLALLPQPLKNSTPAKTISLSPKMETQSVGSQSHFLEPKESAALESTPSVKDLDKRKQLFKILIISLFIFLGLDYAWLKFQAHLKDSPTQININNEG